LFAPENAIELFSDQLHTVVVSTLDRLQTAKHTSSGKHINRFLSEEAIITKQKRRQLKRDWKKTSAEPDQLANFEQCQLANILISESHRKHYAERIADMTDLNNVVLLLTNFYIPITGVLHHHQRKQNYSVTSYLPSSIIKSAASKKRSQVD
jgi:hypothetical protein